MVCTLDRHSKVQEKITLEFYNICLTYTGTNILIFNFYYHVDFTFIEHYLVLA